MNRNKLTRFSATINETTDEKLARAIDRAERASKVATKAVAERDTLRAQLAEAVALLRNVTQGEYPSRSHEVRAFLDSLKGVTQ